MFKSIVPQSWPQRATITRLLNGLFLFLILVAAIWLITFRREAPQMILILLLYVTTINFSLPAAQSAIGLVPIVSVTTLLMMDVRTAVIIAFISIIAAWLAQSFWQPIWENIDVRQPNIFDRLGRSLIFIITLGISGFLYQAIGGQMPPEVTTTQDIISFTILAVTYGLIYTTLSFFLWLIAKRPGSLFFREQALPILGISLLAQPVSLFGATAFGAAGLPIFVIFSLSVLFISILLWLTWQRRYVLEQRLNQFAALNSVGVSLRETLDLYEVLNRIRQTISDMILADRYTITLLDQESGWQKAISLDHTNEPSPMSDPLSGKSVDRDEAVSQVGINADDFTKWITDNGRALELNPQNMHFAQKHNLSAPKPAPAAWMGAPLQTGEETIGALVVQRYAEGRPFTRWNREVLLAVAGQASAAIQNARLYSETVRLYNLTDRALAQRLQQLQALLDTMQEGVIMIDRSATIVLINNVAAQLLGQSPEELRHKPAQADHMAHKLGHKVNEFKRILDQLGANEVPTSIPFTFQIPIEGDDGPFLQRFIERTEAPVIDQKNQIIGWLMLFRDVTEEQELAEQRQDLTRMIVHDLRNPVTTFITNMYLVEGLLPADSEAHPIREAVQDARQSGYDTLDMVDSLMDITRMESGQIVAEVEAVDFAALIIRVVERLNLLARQRKIKLTYNLESELPLIWADEDMIRRVLVNLIDNALKFTPGNGMVHCRVMAEQSNQENRETGIRCIVSDTGPGIPIEHRSQIFNRFTRTNPGGAQIRGTGLGLTFCKLAVEAHQGKIWVEEHAAGGSKFIFTLPGIPIIQDGKF